MRKISGPKMRTIQDITVPPNFMDGIVTLYRARNSTTVVVLQQAKERTCKESMSKYNNIQTLQVQLAKNPKLLPFYSTWKIFHLFLLLLKI